MLVDHTLRNKDSNFYVDIYFTTIKTKRNETSTPDSALLLHTEQCPEPGIDFPSCLTFIKVKPMLLGIVGKALGNLTPPNLMASAFPQTLSSCTALTGQTKCTVLWTKWTFVPIFKRHTLEGWLRILLRNKSAKLSFYQLLWLLLKKKKHFWYILITRVRLTEPHRIKAKCWWYLHDYSSWTGLFHSHLHQKPGS